jgi:hypothetical protein
LQIPATNPGDVRELKLSRMMEKAMADPRQSAEAVRKIQEIQRVIANHQSTIARLERDKSDKVKYIDQQIRREQDEITRQNRQIDDLKRRI